MKATIQAWMMGLLTIALLANCGAQLNEQEKRMVGVWNNSGYDEDEETEEDYRRTRTYDNTFEYKADRTLIQTTVCNERVYVEEEDYDNIITFLWEITGTGTWSIEGNRITEKLNVCDIKLKEIRTAVKKDNDMEYMSQLKVMVEDEIPDWKNSFLEKEKDIIVTLTDDKFVGKSEDGDEFEMIRIK